MGRPRRYQNDAERAQAYRQRLAERTVRVERRSWEQLQARLTRLREAIEGAARAGDLTAMSCRGEQFETILGGLTSHFEMLGGWRRRGVADPDEEQEQAAESG